MGFLETTVKFIGLWLLVDIVIFATGWYLATIIKAFYPDWWRRHIVDEMPNIR